MGREIRMVPPNWQHPRNERGRYLPMFDESYEDAARRWKDDFAAWERGERPSYWSADEGPAEFWDWEGMPPRDEHYRPAWPDGAATWMQAYETVSEGTPVSPPFATPEELVDYLVEHGDFWCQQRPDESPPSREAAEAFVRGGWAPSMMIAHTANGTNLRVGIDACKPTEDVK